MSTPYLGEIRTFGFHRAPTGWFPCDGRLLAIAQYDALYSLLGTTFGGDGVTTFGLPDLRGRLPLHWGNLAGYGSLTLGEKSGSETVTLTQQQIPAHTHGLVATPVAATLATPGTGTLPGAVSGETLYATTTTGATAVPMSAASLSVAGGSQAHDNTMPTLTVNICIAAFGIYPSQN